VRLGWREIGVFHKPHKKKGTEMPWDEQWRDWQEWGGDHGLNVCGGMVVWKAPGFIVGEEGGERYADGGRS